MQPISFEPISSQLLVKGNQKAKELTQPGGLLEGRSTTWVTAPTFGLSFAIGVIEATAACAVSFTTSFFSCYPNFALQERYFHTYMTDSREAVKSIAQHIMKQGAKPIELPPDIENFALRFKTSNDDSTTITLQHGNHEMRVYQYYLASLIHAIPHATDKKTVAVQAQLSEIEEISETTKCPSFYRQRWEDLRSVCTNYRGLSATQKGALKSRIFSNPKLNIDTKVNVVFAQIQNLAAQLTDSPLLNIETITLINSSNHLTRQTVSLWDLPPPDPLELV